MNTQVKRLNLKLKPHTDARLREIAEKTGLKLVTIISMGIEDLYKGYVVAGWEKFQKGGKS